MAVNAWTVFVMRHDQGILKWNTDELKSLNRRTREIIIIHRGLHLKK